MKQILACLSLATLIGVGGCAQFPLTSQSLQSTVQTANALPIADGATTAPPPGFVSFCMRSPQACVSAGPARDAVVRMDDPTAATLVAVNNRVNNSIIYKTDLEQYGVPNRWTLGAIGGYGDCKAYALAKQDALRSAGLPTSALRIAIVRTTSDELHAVLTVDTDKGVLVLDSLTSDIRPWSETHYRWLMRQAQDGPLHWVQLADNGDMPAGAVLAGDPHAW